MQHEPGATIPAPPTEPPRRRGKPRDAECAQRVSGYRRLARASRSPAMSGVEMLQAIMRRRGFPRRRSRRTLDFTLVRGRGRPRRSSRASRIARPLQPAGHACTAAGSRPCSTRRWRCVGPARCCRPARPTPPLELKVELSCTPAHRQGAAGARRSATIVHCGGAHRPPPKAGSLAPTASCTLTAPPPVIVSSTLAMTPSRMRFLHTMLRVGDLQRSIRLLYQGDGHAAPAHHRAALSRSTVAGLRRLRLAIRSTPRSSSRYNHGRRATTSSARAYGHIAIGVHRRAGGLRPDPCRRWRGHARGRAGEGRNDGDRLRHRPRRLQDRADRARRRLGPCARGDAAPGLRPCAARSPSRARRVIRAQSLAASASARRQPRAADTPARSAAPGTPARCRCAMPPVGRSATSAKRPGAAPSSIADAARRTAGKNLRKRKPSVGRLHDLARGGHAGQQRQAELAAGRGRPRACSPG